jgi:ABC-type multidrug transport system ATPase subunit
LTLELQNVSKRFSGSLAVDSVNFRARAGEITGYLGPNSSGKSTTIKMIVGLIDMTSLDVAVAGGSRPPYGPHAPWHDSRRGLPVRRAEDSLHMLVPAR